MLRAALMLAGLMLAGAAAAGEPPPEFAKQPTADDDGDKVRIEFAAGRATDVAVCVEDAKGRVVRHLAAGALGPKAPPPLKADALEQSLVWDRRDDLGKPAAAEAGPFKVRVSLGLRPSFDQLIGYEPAELGGVRGLACAPDGNLYVFHCYGSAHPNDGTTACAVFSREGKYLRTILPYPANLPEEKLKGLKRLELPGGAKVPFICQVETRSFLPGLGDLPSQRPVVTRDGRLAFVGVQEGPRPFAQPGEARLTVVGTDGSVPPAGALRTLIAPLTDTGASLALSPDEQTIYAVGVRAGTHAVKPDSVFVCNTCDHGGETWRHTVPTRLVYRFGWDDVQAQVFAEKTALKDPVSVAADRDGNVYVADAGDNQVVVFKPDGSYLGRIKVDAPQRVEVHKATGAVYVLSGEKDMELVKFDGYARGKRLARLKKAVSAKDPFPPTRRPAMALDDSAEPPAIWLGRPLVRVEDRGKEFGEPVPLLPPAPEKTVRSIGPVMDLSLDRQREVLYVNNCWRYGPAAGAWSRLAFPKELRNYGGGSNPGATNGSAGLDGNYYVCRGARAPFVHRFGADGKPLPFPAAARSGDKEGRLHGFAKDHGCGLTADAAGNVYVIWKKCPNDPGDAQRAHALYAYDADGAPRKGPLVDAEVPGIYSVRADFAGNLYLAVGLRPGKAQLPPGLELRLPEGPRDPDAVNGLNGYPLIYGSIVKFGPEGGAIRAGSGGVPCNYAHGTPIEVKGAKWIFPGASTVASWATPKKTPGTVIICMCERPGLDVDGYGRSFFADAGRFRVGVLDTAGNELCTFGAYGNQDSAGPASAVPAPEIALAWPQAVAVGDGWAYVGDRLNRRIVRVKLGSAAEAACAVP